MTATVRKEFKEGYTLEELEAWDQRIRDAAEEFGLCWYSQDFEICDHYEMLSYITYSGMPSHYPHWSYGKAYERQKTLYDYGITGLPYEMVINSNPCLAYLMRDNTMLLQILTMAHVYAHNDFFKNNYYFSFTEPELTIERFKTRANRVRDYLEDPSIGLERVERVLDAVHALQYQCQRNPAIRKLSPEEQRTRLWEDAQEKDDPYRSVKPPHEYIQPDLDRVPLEPDEDLLLFVRDHCPSMPEWEKDLLTIVHETAQYFIPQIETKIMNEGWATYWHKRILESLELPQGMKMEFMVRHNQVVRPIPGGINPYHLGFRIFQDIFRRWEEPDEKDREENGLVGGEGQSKIMAVRETDRDVSFLRQYLTEDLIRDLLLFEHDKSGQNRVVTEIADRDGWRKIKQTLIQNAGSSAIPVIKVEEVDYKAGRELLLKHYFDGRELDLVYAEKTLQHMHTLWRATVKLATVLQDAPCLLVYDGEKLDIRKDSEG